MRHRAKRVRPFLVIDLLDRRQYLRVLADLTNPRLLDMKDAYLAKWLDNLEGDCAYVDLSRLSGVAA